MNETDLLAGLREEIPLELTSRKAEALFLTGLERAIGDRASAQRRAARRPGARRLHLTRNLALTGGLSAAVAAAVAVVMVMSGSHPGARSSPAVRELAYRVAAAAGRQPQISPSQWIYWKEVRRMDDRASAFGVWTTANPVRAAFIADGRVYNLRIGSHAEQQYIGQPKGTLTRLGAGFEGVTGTIPVSYAQLGSLPRTPAALLDYLANLKFPHSNLWGPPAEREFAIIEEMITSYVMPPRLTAEVYQALGEIPGVTVDMHASDVAGRSGVGFISTAAADGSKDEIIVSSRTYHLMGDDTLDARGHVSYGTAILRKARVSGPGVLP
jgi:hypothetical protein